MSTQNGKVTILDMPSIWTKVLSPNLIAILSESGFELHCIGLLDGSSLTVTAKVFNLILLWVNEGPQLASPD